MMHRVLPGVELAAESRYRAITVPERGFKNHLCRELGKRTMHPLYWEGSATSALDKVAPGKFSPQWYKAGQSCSRALGY